jgi:hypothetical protein
VLAGGAASAVHVAHAAEHHHDAAGLVACVGAMLVVAFAALVAAVRPRPRPVRWLVERDLVVPSGLPLPVAPAPRSRAGPAALAVWRR